MILAPEKPTPEAFRPTTISLVLTCEADVQALYFLANYTPISTLLIGSTSDAVRARLKQNYGTDLPTANFDEYKEELKARVRSSM